MHGTSASRGIRNAHWRVLWRDITTQVAGSEQADSVHLEETIDWLVRAQQYCGRGVAAGYHLLRGWDKPYPETTGYIIPTFLRYAALTRQTSFIDRAAQMGEWELEIQLENGAIPGRTGRDAEPTVFDTGQVIFGWLMLARITGDERYVAAACRAADWLLQVQDADGAWRRFEFNGVAHAYNTRVAWPLLLLGKHVQCDKYLHAGKAQLRWVLSRRQPNAWISGMAFAPNEHAFTHTIAYTLEGLWESAMLVEEDLSAELRQTVRGAWRAMDESFGLGEAKTGRVLSGQLGDDWQARGNFTCLTGNAQLAMLAMRMYQERADARLMVAARRLLDDVKTAQHLDVAHGGIRGGVAGSSPVWGGYLTWWYPNWAAKFFSDALMLYTSIVQKRDTSFWENQAG